MNRWDFHNFSWLSKVLDDVTNNHLFIYIEHLKAVPEDVLARFHDLLDFKVFPWLVESFPTNISVNECVSSTQKLLIDLQTDQEARAIFNAHEWADFWRKVQWSIFGTVGKSRVDFIGFSFNV